MRWGSTPNRRIGLFLIPLLRFIPHNGAERQDLVLRHSIPIFPHVTDTLRVI